MLALSAVLVGLMGSPLGGSAALASARPAQAREVVVVDAGVPDYQRLVNDVRARRVEGRDVDVVVLDPQRDGIAQLSDALAHRRGLAAIHILSHGSVGAIDIGSAHLDAARLASEAESVARWGQALDADGDLLLYGCDVAAGGRGQAFIGRLARLTGADPRGEHQRHWKRGRGW